jgi:4-amino-4-deoxy-L-arabinose transferase-like glycosyltransferase
MSLQKINPHVLLTIGICSILLIPSLFMDGMFMDGVLYSSVSKNYAHGNGTLWNMTFSLTAHHAFHEQPPLMFALQSAFFKIFGDSMYTERIYSLCAAILSTLLLARCWTHISMHRSTSWFPVLIWFIMPVTFYGYINNLEECTMTVFILASLTHILRALNAPKELHLHWLLAGFWLLLAGLTKGIQGMFLLAAPFWVMIFIDKGKFLPFVRRSVLIGAIPALFVVIALLNTEIRDSFSEYFGSRFVNTFNGTNASTNSRFHMLFELLIDTLPSLALILITLFAMRKVYSPLKMPAALRSKLLFLLACGFSGILPLMVTLEQRGFYLIPPISIIALFIALIGERQIAVIQTNRENSLVYRRIASIAGTIIILTSVITTVLKAGEFKRDADTLTGLKAVSSITGQNTYVMASTGIMSDWPVICYAQRFHGFSLHDNAKAYPAPWYVERKGENSAPPGFVPVNCESAAFSLYRAP